MTVLIKHVVIVLQYTMLWTILIKLVIVLQYTILLCVWDSLNIVVCLGQSCCVLQIYVITFVLLYY